MEQRIFLIFIFFLTGYYNMFALSDSISTPLHYKHLHSTLVLTTGFVFGADSKDLFDAYRSGLGGTTPEFKVTPNVGLAAKYELLEGWKFGLSIDYYNASFSESIDQSLSDKLSKPKRLLAEDVSVTTLPFLLTVETVPLETQFRTYCGIGLGISTGNITWNERVNSQITFDKRTGGSLFDRTVTVPAFRVYAGTELGFDKHLAEQFVGSLIIELRYTYIMRNIDMFGNLSKQFDKPPVNWKSSYNVLPGYITLLIGITFNFKRNTAGNKPA